MKKIFLASTITGIFAFLVFSYNYANFSQASIKDIQTYQELINKQLKEKKDIENKLQEEKNILHKIFITLKIASIKLKKQEDFSVCTKINENIKLIPDSVFIENQLDRDKIESLYKKLQIECKEFKIQLIKAKYKEILKQHELEKKIKQQQFENNRQQLESNKKSSIPTYQQKYLANTCVIDNLSLITQYQYGKELDKTRIYKKLGKQIGDFWRSGFFVIGQYGGSFIPVKENTLGVDSEGKIFYLSELTTKPRLKGTYKKITERRDWEKLEEQTGLKTSISSSVWYLKEILRSWNAVLIEIPMSLLYPNDKKWEWKNIFHAISVYQYNEQTNELVYSNTLTNQIEMISLDKFLYDKNYLKYPFRFITEFDPTKYTYFKE